MNKAGKGENKNKKDKQKLEGQKTKKDRYNKER